LRQRKPARRGRVSDGGIENRTKESTMRALQDFFSTDYGLLSAAVIAITLGMAAFFTRFFITHMRADEARERERLAAKG
jgi:hypothetical protein